MLMRKDVNNDFSKDSPIGVELVVDSCQCSASKAFSPGTPLYPSSKINISELQFNPE